MLGSWNFDETTLRHVLFLALYLFCAFAHFFAKSKRKPPPLEPLIFAKSPSHLFYAENVESLWMPKSLDITTLKNQCGLNDWTDSLLAQQKSHQKIKAQAIRYRDFPTNKRFNAAIMERLLHPIEDFVITPIHPTVGLGVFLSLHAKPIPGGTVLGIYAGEYFPKKPKKLFNSQYVMCLFANKAPRFFKSLPRVDSRQYGNFSRFMQDLPNEEELLELNLPPSILSLIATENVEAHETLCQGLPVMAFMSIRDIAPGEQIGFSYRGDYWSGDRIKLRCLFHRDGRLLGRFLGKTQVKIDPRFTQLISPA